MTIAFSPLGLVLAVAVLAPSALLLAFPPRTPLPKSGVPRVLRIVESAGQALCVAVPVLTAPGPVAWWWCLPAGAFLAVYYGLWMRYLARGRTAALLYLPLGPIPVPMAAFPVLTFLAGAAWLSDMWIAVAALILAAGHIPASLVIAAAVTATTRRRG